MTIQVTLQGLIYLLIGICIGRIIYSAALVLV